MLRTSDIVSLHVPLTPATKHMMSAAQFRLMKPTAYLINTCRGPVVDEPAMYEALTNGTIAGAGLDVFDQEPPPANNPLFNLDNVILTPHYAGPTWDNQTSRFRTASTTSSASPAATSRCGSFRNCGTERARISPCEGKRNLGVAARLPRDRRGWSRACQRLAALARNDSDVLMPVTTVHSCSQS